MYLENCAILMLPIGHHRKWLCYFVPYAMENWTFVLFKAGLKSVFEMVHISKAEIAKENNLPRVLEKRVCLFADTFTCVSN